MNSDLRQTVREKNPYWGAWTTVGFGIIVFIAFSLLHLGAVIGYLYLMVDLNPDFDIESYNLNIETNGFLVALTTCISAPICIGVIMIFVKLKKRASVKEYLGLKLVRSLTMFKWLGITFLLIVISDSLTYLLGKPILPDFMIDTYTTASFVPLIWIAFVVAAPLFEELFMRGFLLKGLQHSRLGPMGGVLLTALVWAAIHTQYDLYYVVIIFIFGIILGISRITTQSVYPAIAMHSFTSLIATLQVAIYLGTQENGF